MQFERVNQLNDETLSSLPVALKFKLRGRRGWPKEGAGRAQDELAESNSRTDLIFYFQTLSHSIFLRKSRKETCLKSHYNPPRTEHVPCGPPAQMIAPNGDDDVNIQFLQPKYLRVQKNYKKATEKFFFR